MTVKAGPKKKQEKEERLLREAITENARPIRSRTTRVRSYTYKAPAKSKEKRVLSPDPSMIGMNDRNSRDWHAWEEVIIFVDGDKVLDELEIFQMLCDHKALRDEKAVATLTEDREYRRCPHCQAILRWYGSYTTTIQAEWMTYRVEGYSMEEWGAFFDRDKTLWPFVLEVAQAEKEEN